MVVDVVQRGLSIVQVTAVAALLAVCRHSNPLGCAGRRVWHRLSIALTARVVRTLRQFYA